jgi:hypothetical protein
MKNVFFMDNARRLLKDGGDGPESIRHILRTLVGRMPTEGTFTLARIPAAGEPFWPKLYVFSEVHKGVLKHLFFALDDLDELPMGDESKEEIRRMIAKERDSNWQRVIEGD